MVVGVIALGLLAGPISGIALEAANQIVTPELYINAVLGK